MQVKLKQDWVGNPAGSTVFLDARTAYTLAGLNIGEIVDLRIYSDPAEGASLENSIMNSIGGIYNYDFDDAYQFNTYDAVTFNFEQSPAFSLTGASIYMQLREKPGDEVIDEFSTVNGRLSILSEFTFSLIQQIISTNPGTYLYDILIVYADGTQKTYIIGIWTINPTITQIP